jgi:two-component system OmpR family sensor kinase
VVPIRWKIALASTFGVLILLGGSGLLFLTTLRSGLQNSVDNSLRARVDELSAQVNADGTVRTTVVGGTLHLTGNTYGQLLGPADDIVQTTDDALSGPLLDAANLRKVRPTGRFFDVTAVETAGKSHDQSLRVLAEPLGRGGLTVAVGISRDVVDEAVERAGKQLLVLGAIVLLVAGPGAWLLTRSALRPVERMRAQAALLEAQDAGGGLSVPTTRDEIGRLGATLNDLLARLHGALERERAFVADAGHELRTPLTVLRGELELARRPGRSRAELQETIEIAAEETERLVRLAEDLLVLAREDGNDSDRWSKIDVAALVATACARLESAARARQISFEQPGESRLWADADPDRLRQAVDNVLANALRFAPVASVIEIEVSEQDGRAIIEICDQGPGFPKSLLPVAFERFRRADVARTRGASGDEAQAGAGLGLAIVQTILRSHRGVAVVANRSPEAGARVTLSWPVDLTTAVAGRG